LKIQFSYIHAYNIIAMHFTKIVPSIFYADVQVGLKLFVECLEFTIGHDELHSDHPFCVVDKDGLSIMLFENAEYAEKEHPEYRLVTNNIEDVYKKVATKFPELLHPNLKEVTLRPWGAREFALLDGQIGIRVQQW
jgi:predicted HAD superfamily hydrolase